MDVKINLNNRGQMTIIILFGIAIVLAIAIYFSVKFDLIGSKDVGENPEKFLSECIENKVRETITTLGLQGGEMEPKFYRDFQFEDSAPQKIAYLCYTSRYYTPCVNQKPMLISDLEIELKKEIAPEVENCFNEIVDSLSEKREVSSNYFGFDLALEPGKIVVNLNAEINLIDGEQTTNYNNLKTEIESKFYDIAVVVQETLSQEARFCSFEQLGFMLLYPQFDINKFRTGDGDIIYRIKHRTSKEEFDFIVRTCVTMRGS